jgi:hypothetical protein
LRPDKTRLLLQADNADRFQEPQHADGVGISGVFRAFEADADMALGGDIVDLSWLICCISRIRLVESVMSP